MHCEHVDDLREKLNSILFFDENYEFTSVFHMRLWFFFRVIVFFRWGGTIAPQWQDKVKNKHFQPHQIFRALISILSNLESFYYQEEFLMNV